MAVDPKCLAPSVDFGKIGEGAVAASICGFSLKIPRIPIPPVSIALPDITALLPKLPIPKLSFALTCDLNNPIDITASIPFGGGRIACVDPTNDPDEQQFAEAA